MSHTFTTATEAGHSKLYHYQRYNPEHLADLLTNKRVHCATPGQLNDPWDCRPWFNVSSVLANPDELERCLEAYYKYCPATVPDEFRTLYGEMLRSDPSALRAAVISLSISIQQEIAKRRIYCLTPLPDNVLMWSHYAENHKGVCLEFDTRVRLFETALAVTYRKAYSALPPFTLDPDLVLSSVVTKSDVWAYENEFRVLGLPNRNLGLEVELDGNYLAIGDALTGVILGCQADVPSMRKFFKGHAPDIPLYQAVRANDEYRLHVIRLPTEHPVLPKDPLSNRRRKRSIALRNLQGGVG